MSVMSKLVKVSVSLSSQIRNAVAVKAAGTIDPKTKRRYSAARWIAEVVKRALTKTKEKP